MEAFLPSEIGRLIYGYLFQQCGAELAKEFLNSCDVMRECRLFKQQYDKNFHHKVQDLTLEDILNQYSVLCSLIFQNTTDEEPVHRNILDLLKKIIFSKLDSSTLFSDRRTRSNSLTIVTVSKTLKHLDESGNRCELIDDEGTAFSPLNSNTEQDTIEVAHKNSEKNSPSSNSSKDILDSTSQSSLQKSAVVDSKKVANNDESVKKNSSDDELPWDLKLRDSQSSPQKSAEVDSKKVANNDESVKKNSSDDELPWDLKLREFVNTDSSVDAHVTKRKPKDLRCRRRRETPKKRKHSDFLEELSSDVKRFKSDGATSAPSVTRPKSIATELAELGGKSDGDVQLKVKSSTRRRRTPRCNEDETPSGLDCNVDRNKKVKGKSAAKSIVEQVNVARTETSSADLKNTNEADSVPTNLADLVVNHLPNPAETGLLYPEDSSVCRDGIPTHHFDDVSCGDDLELAKIQPQLPINEKLDEINDSRYDDDDGDCEMVLEMSQEFELYYRLSQC